MWLSLNKPQVPKVKVVSWCRDANLEYRAVMRCKDYGMHFDLVFGVAHVMNQMHINHWLY